MSLSTSSDLYQEGSSLSGHQQAEKVNRQSNHEEAESKTKPVQKKKTSERVLAFIMSDGESDEEAPDDEEKDREMA